MRCADRRRVQLNASVRRWQRGHKTGSPEEQDIADYRERGLGYTNTTLLIN